ncbi:glycosyltransferase family 1 protein [Aquimarina sp. 2201CG14-23]|uniref:glycosyltransferase family 1 protein n=1 Tax=Aquimarina mycalae TaxID=3040073 RepID=UPI0024780032|nr:glycosyltransferase family 1 protein [Aquimarina sp. 2201CG14-23]MDH7446573.1 glycosyltransferase family 1 protein [Aquimarina sp. 2201CG14-23]
MSITRVLQVFTIMNRGGSESMIMNYYRKIDRNKVQFDFLVHRTEKAVFDDEIEKLGGKIYRFNPINPLAPTSYYNELRAFFKNHPEYNIVHAHLNTFSCFPLKIAKEFNIPVRIAHAHIAMDTLNLASVLRQKESLKDVVKQIIKLQLRKKIHKYPTHYFSCGDKAGKWLFGTNSTFQTMNNAIDTDAFRYDPEIANTYKKEFNIDKELVIGHVGRFDSQKNHSFLLKIFASLVELKPKSRLLLIGDGHFRSTIEQEARKLLIADKIEFLGVRSDVPALFQVMDVFVFPSLYEGLPVTLIEAQAAGLQVFASDTITEEVRLTNLIEFISLQESPEFWAKKIDAAQNITKKDTKHLIVQGAYDIIDNAKKTQEFYLTCDTN